jgi:hypothetical protein
MLSRLVLELRTVTVYTYFFFGFTLFGEFDTEERRGGLV